ncbi:AAA family ATPase, partial [Candidatus Magnetaquicoccus inordinatus]|uniref:AAA family ATPase n=1 Tax=Candidatus Magnetaquicoccus inordinatus TaxID=2496818 RepID=UPI00102C5158
MHISVSNFLGIKEASIEIDGITLLTGPNGAGKSSILMAAAACATGSIVPVVLPTGKEAVARGGTRGMVHGDEKKATSVLLNGDKSLTISWPSNALKGEIPVACHPLAAGMVEWMSITPADRKKMLGDAMNKAGINATPDNIDLAVAMAAVGIKDSNVVDFVYQKIQALGWDGAHKEVSESWSESKGAWSATTGELYGEKKAETWVPAGWNDGLNSADEKSLAEKLASAEQALEDGIARRAIDGEEIRRIRESAEQQMIDTSVMGSDLLALQGELDALQKTDITTDAIILIESSIASKQAEIDKMQQSLAEEQNKILALPVIPMIPQKTNSNATCPSCGIGLFVSTGISSITVEPETVRTEEDLQNATKERDLAKQELNRIESINTRITQSITAIKVKIADLQSELTDLQTKKIAAIRDAEKTINTEKHALTAQIAETKASINAADMHNSHIHTAKKRFIELTEKQQANTVTGQEINDLRAQRDAAMVNLQMYHNKAKATQHAFNAIRRGKVRTILAQDGLRATKMQDAIGAVHDAINHICGAAGWKQINMDDDLNLYAAGIPY